MVLSNLRLEVRTTEQLELVNRAVILVDGDNLMGTFHEYQHLITPSRLREWVLKGPLGISSITYACFLRSYKHARHVVKGRDRWHTRKGGHWWLYEYWYVNGEKGYSDESLRHLAISLAEDYETLVIVSSDGGRSSQDGGFPQMRREIQAALPDKEVVLIGSRLNTPVGWAEDAGNCEYLEDIFPDLAAAEAALGPPA